MKKHALAVVAIAALAGISWSSPAFSMPASAPEAQELMKSYFGNTRICRTDGLFECHGWYYPDGTYLIFSYRSNKLPGDHGFRVRRGTWTIEGTKGAYRLCRHEEGSPAQAPSPNCGLPEPTRPDLVGETYDLGENYWKFHETGELRGTTEHYYMIKGQR